MWETRHLLHRTLLMDLYGLHPYTEVSAEYRTDSNVRAVSHVPGAQAVRRLARTGLFHVSLAPEPGRTVVCLLCYSLVPRCQSAHGWWRSLC